MTLVLPGSVTERKRVRMRPAVSLVVLLLVGVAPAAPARADAARGRAARALKPLVIRPMDSSAACSLEWRSTPYWLRPGQRVVQTVMEGWLGADAPVKPEALRLGISGVYYDGETRTTTFAIIGFAFRTEEDAMRAEKILADRYAKTNAQRFMRRGPYVVILAEPPPTNEGCAAWMADELGRRLARVSP
jgi:hypothetical protein